MHLCPEQLCKPKTSILFFFTVVIVYILQFFVFNGWVSTPNLSRQLNNILNVFLGHTSCVITSHQWEREIFKGIKYICPWYWRNILNAYKRLYYYNFAPYETSNSPLTWHYRNFIYFTPLLFRIVAKSWEIPLIFTQKPWFA